jgi:ribosomal-protein-alanine N-acetyltransferase
LSIRAAIAADVPAMLGLERAAATAAHWAAAEYARIFAVGQTARVVLVAEEGGGLLGFVVARTLGSEWEIENIAVAAHAQRRGVATALLRELFSLARQQGAARVYLEVRESNHAARALYEKCAFAIAGRRRAYYSGPQEDAVVYQRWVGN